MIGRTLTLIVTLGCIAAASLVPTMAADNSGYLYGTIETTSNSYTGFLRWGTEEAFWDDHFNSSIVDHDTTRGGGLWHILFRYISAR